MLAAAAGRRPVVLVLDDLHWADRASLRLLAHLAAAPEPAALLIVGTYRHTDLGRRHPLAAMLADLRREPTTERLALTGLDAAATVELIGGWVGEEAGPELAAQVRAETEGNPFFIEEVLRDLVEGGELVRRDGRWRADGALRVPESVREVIGRRVERLPDSAVAVLEAAAVLGRDFDLQVLVASGVLPRDALLDGLEEAERAQLVRPLPGVGRWAFSHALVREALYDELPSSRRARLHAAAADGLVGVGGAPAEAAFHAYEAATLEGPRRAVALAREAAAEALAGLDYEAASAHLARALEALELDQGADPLERADLLIERGEALARAAEPDALAAFDAARELARATGDGERLGRAALGLCGVGVTIIDLDLERAAMLEEAIGALGEDAPGLRARLLGAAGDRARVCARPGPQRAAERGGRRRRARERRHRRAARRAERPPRRALAPGRAGRALRRGRRDDRPCRRPRPAGGRAAGPQLARGRPVGGRRHLPASRASWRATRRSPSSSACRRSAGTRTMWRAALATMRGEHSAADALIDEAVALGARGGDGNVELCAGMLRMQIAIQENRFEDYDFAFVDDKIATSPAGPAYRGSRAWALAELGRDEEARADLAWLSADNYGRLPFDFNWLSAVGESAEAIAALGEPALADDLYALVLPYADRTLVAGRAICSQGSMHHYLGRLAATARRPFTAIRHFTAALEAQERSGSRAWSVRTRARLADALAEAGEQAAAEREAGIARAEAAALGLPSRAAR